MKTFVFYLFVFLYLFMYTNANAQKDDKICGSVEKYKQTGKWRDLPGCISDYHEEGDESQTTAGILAYAKMKFKKFYENWDAYNFFDEKNPLDVLSGACEFFKNPFTKDKWNSDPQLQAAEPLFEARAKQAMEEYELFNSTWRSTIVELSGICMSQVNSLSDSKKRIEAINNKTAPTIYRILDHSEWENTLKTINELYETVKNDKIPEAIVVGVEENNKYITIADMRDQYLKKWEAIALELEKKEREWYEEGLAPYMKVMSGEKATAFRRWFGITLYGPGGKKLKTPEDFANARAWYTSGSAVCTICPRWAVEGIHFSGNKVVNKTREEGQGTFPPDSIFK